MYVHFLCVWVCVWVGGRFFLFRLERGWAQAGNIFGARVEISNFGSGTTPNIFLFWVTAHTVRAKRTQWNNSQHDSASKLPHYVKFHPSVNFLSPLTHALRVAGLLNCIWHHFWNIHLSPNLSTEATRMEKSPSSPSFICFTLGSNRIKDDNCWESQQPWRQEKANTVNEWVNWWIGALLSKCALKYANLEIRPLWCHKGLHWCLVWSCQTTSQPPYFWSLLPHMQQMQQRSSNWVMFFFFNETANSGTMKLLGIFSISLNNLIVLVATIKNKEAKKPLQSSSKVLYSPIQM